MIPVSFGVGREVYIPTTKVPGRFIVATDTGASFLDTSSSTRVQLKDTTKLPLSGGQMEGELILTGVGTDDYSAVPKSYVDSTVGNITDILASLVDGTDVQSST